VSSNDNNDDNNNNNNNNQYNVVSKDIARIFMVHLMNAEQCQAATDLGPSQFVAILLLLSPTADNSFYLFPGKLEACVNLGIAQ